MAPTGPGELPPIADYGLVGDTRTAALVSSGGAIDWLCVPRFDGEPLFGRLVGGPPAGGFRMAPAGEATPAGRRYLGASATLETSWDTPTGRLVLTDGMVAEVTGRLLPTTLLVRRLAALGGPVEAVIEFDPGSASATAGRRPGAATAPWSASGAPWRPRCGPPRTCRSSPDARCGSRSLRSGR